MGAFATIDAFATFEADVAMGVVATIGLVVITGVGVTTAVAFGDGLTTPALEADISDKADDEVSADRAEDMAADRSCCVCSAVGSFIGGGAGFVAPIVTDFPIVAVMVDIGTGATTRGGITEGRVVASAILTVLPPPPPPPLPRLAVMLVQKAWNTLVRSSVENWLRTMKPSRV